MSSLDYRQSIHNLLQALPNRRLDALKQLFWTELNYERLNIQIQDPAWPESIIQTLAEPVLLFAAAGKDFHIIFCHLNRSLSLSVERQIVSKLLANYPYGMFIFSNHDQSQWHFVNVKHTSAETAPTRRLFRRISITPNQPLRTPVERIALLDLDLIYKDHVGVTAANVQKRHDEAFDVEKVTKDFFTAYRRIFEQAEASITLNWSREARRLYTQRFFNRLMFLAFLERKGWLVFNSRYDYLRALFEDYLQNDPDKRREANFHRKRLNALFFVGLNHARGDQHENIRFVPIFNPIGEVPYLNGGLFEREVDDEEWFFPDQIVAQILGDLIYRFNFTVTESTPLDVEVAVDPEMLGRIFEELVTGRHESGSYYTPKAVVAFMCREALKGYLKSVLRQESDRAIDQYIDQSDPSQLKNPEGVLKCLREVRACDPACGSGAYLVGLLHELLELRAALFAVRQLDARTVYERKLEIIQNNLYGVDIDPFAVNIARLRLWLSLIVDFEGQNPPPLPNLNYKIETGDSLTAPNPSAGLELGFRRQLIDTLIQAKQEFLTAHDDRKSSLREEIERLKTGIQQWSGRPVSEEAFDWAVEFPEIFVIRTEATAIAGAIAGSINQVGGQVDLVSEAQSKIGFDLVLANPPYVRADAQFKHIEDENERQNEITRWRAYRTRLKTSDIYKTLYEKWDLYIPFLERAYQLLGSNGQMIYIVSDAYNAAKYAKKSHDFFLGHSRIVRIDFCSEIDLFDAGVNNTILHFEKDLQTAEHRPVRVRRWGERDEFDRNFQLLTTDTQLPFGRQLFRVDGSSSEETFETIPLEQIVYISYGLRANANDREWQGEFKTVDCISPIKDDAHPKPFIQGKDIIKWAKKTTWYLEWGTDRSPVKFSRPTFIELQEARPKILAMKNSGVNPVALFDDAMTFFDATLIGFVPWYILTNVINRSIEKTAKYKFQDAWGNREERESVSENFHMKYILAVINSSYTKEYIARKRRHKISIYPNDWKQLPIAQISIEAQGPFVKKVDAILDEFAKHGYPLPKEAERRVKELEHQLDEMVAKLYET